MKARAPTPAITPSPFEDDNEAVEEIAALMNESHNRINQRMLRRHYLRRDDYRCMVTGIIDYMHAPSAMSSSGLSGPTELAHILPLSIGKWVSSEDVCKHCFC